jgi:hypothetical protein
MLIFNLRRGLFATILRRVAFGVQRHAGQFGCALGRWDT